MSSALDPEVAARVASGALAAFAFGFALIQRFVEPRSEYRKRVKFLREKCVERQATSLVQVAYRIRQTVETEELFRTEDLNSPDVTSEFCRASRKLCSDMIRLDLSRFGVRLAFWTLIATGSASFLLFATTFLWPETSSFIAVLSIILVLILCLAVWMLCGISDMLERMENDD